MKIIQAGRLKFSEFVFNNTGSFQQSFQWGELQEELGREVDRLLIIDNNQITASAQLIKHDLPFGKFYWFCPKGPIFRKELVVQSPELIKEAIELIVAYVKKNLDGMFLRIEPEFSVGGEELLDFYPLVKAPKDHNPRSTVLIDLQSSSEELLKSMHHKTRYNINLAKKRGVVVSEVENKQERFGEFYNLLKKTAGRGKFHLHPKKHYEELIHISQIKMFAATYKGKIIATGLVSFFNEKAVYMHGASSYHERAVMAPHLLHWQIILEAKNANLKNYDFGGVAPKGEPDHPLQGVTRFKQGFGGEYVESVGSWDAVFSILWYELYKIVRVIL